MTVFTTAYFPPVEYFALIAKYSDFCVEAFENYQKQSYRNRCYFYGSGGKEMLQVPVIHENGTFRHPISKIRVDYSTPWVVRTERAIDSAYRSSAFFDYYRDGIFDILDSKPERLWDLNTKITGYFLEKTGLKTDIQFTDDFRQNGYENDFRESVHPKKPVIEGLKLEKPYFQVFSQKHGFISNLSIMDLLFNEGPESNDYLLSL